MKIGILTQPLHNNYGGILQAYALQQTLKAMGHEVWLVNRRRKEPTFFRKLASIGKKAILKRSLTPFFSLLNTAEEKRIVSIHTNQFIQSHFDHITEKITSTKDMRELSKCGFHAFIVGSDQVWRPMYSPCITNYFLDFLDSGLKIKRLAYAASFGVDNWEFNTSQTKECSCLVKKFDAISVREDSGVSLCKEYLKVDATHVLDPTMLLYIQDYILLAKKANFSQKAGGLMIYMLDETASKSRIVNYASEVLKLDPFFLMPSKFRNIHNKKMVSVFPPVESWLQGFLDSEFIITDSFHGTVFSILFNKPFIVIGNENRGMSRFNSLLRMFGLESRLIKDDSDIYSHLFSNEINWEQVNRILKRNRTKSKNFIINNLNYNL